MHGHITFVSHFFCMGVLLLFFDECPNWHVKLLVDGARRWMRRVTNDCSDFIGSTLRSSLDSSVVRPGISPLSIRSCTFG
jgi:hypothetical protein